ncbi:MAG: asparagine--tRNA ligase [Bacteroidales bacterium]|nr:asparagine--tRNA ligase [Bacteroidales bacterium]
MLTHTEIKDLLQVSLQEGEKKEVTVKAWVRTKRGNKYVAFIALNDGTCVQNLQVVADLKTEENPGGFDEELLKRINTGACLRVKGDLVKSMGKGQTVEVQAREIEVYGEADPEKYPLQKKGHSLEFLREIAHLRPRTNTFGCVLRLRHAMAYALHRFYHERGFVYLHTPIITGSDCEGAGEMFQVTTLDLENLPRTQEGCIDYTKDFFGKSTKLTVSGQLEGELGAMALSKIYTFGPTFRAENSNTPRHLAEFWMNEPEMAFYEIDDNMDLAEDFLKHLTTYALEHCMSDLQFMNDTYDKELIGRLENILKTNFERITYTQAVDVL